MAKLPDLVIGDLRINPPIIQGGMGINISRAGLAAAVANEGCVGTISAITGGTSARRSPNLEEQELRDQIRLARRNTTGILAVNVLVALTNYDAIVKTAVEEGIDIVISGAGLPLNLPRLVQGSKTKICPIVSSARTAEIICKSWQRKHQRLPDAIIIEGPLAGGHLGYSFTELEEEPLEGKLEKILDDVLKVAKAYSPEKPIPVIVAGGIYDGKDIVHMIRRGAAGVQMGTRFVCTNECDAAQAFKDAYIKARANDIRIIRSPVGMPGRALQNDFLTRSHNGEVKVTCHYRCLKGCVPTEAPYCISDALLNASRGEFQNGFVFVGANVHRVTEIVPVKALITELVRDAERELDTCACANQS